MEKNLVFPLVGILIVYLATFCIGWYGLSIVNENCDSASFLMLRLMIVGGAMMTTCCISELICHVSCETPDEKPSKIILMGSMILGLGMFVITLILLGKIGSITDDSDKAGNFQLACKILIPFFPAIGIYSGVQIWRDMKRTQAKGAIAYKRTVTQEQIQKSKKEAEKTRKRKAKIDEQRYEKELLLSLEEEKKKADIEKQQARQELERANRELKKYEVTPEQEKDNKRVKQTHVKLERKEAIQKDYEQIKDEAKFLMQEVGLSEEEVRSMNLDNASTRKKVGRARQVVVEYKQIQEKLNDTRKKLREREKELENLEKKEAKLQNAQLDAKGEEKQKNNIALNNIQPNIIGIKTAIVALSALQNRYRTELMGKHNNLNQIYKGLGIGEIEDLEDTNIKIERELISAEFESPERMTDLEEELKKLKAKQLEQQIELTTLIKKRLKENRKARQQELQKKITETKKAVGDIENKISVINRQLSGLSRNSSINIEPPPLENPPEDTSGDDKKHVGPETLLPSVHTMSPRGDLMGTEEKREMGTNTTLEQGKGFRRPTNLRRSPKTPSPQNNSRQTPLLQPIIEVESPNTPNSSDSESSQRKGSLRPIVRSKTTGSMPLRRPPRAHSATSLYSEIGLESPHP